MSSVKRSGSLKGGVRGEQAPGGRSSQEDVYRLEWSVGGRKTGPVDTRPGVTVVSPLCVHPPLISGPGTPVDVAPAPLAPTRRLPPRSRRRSPPPHPTLRPNPEAEPRPEEGVCRLGLPRRGRPLPQRTDTPPDPLEVVATVGSRVDVEVTEEVILPVREETRDPGSQVKEGLEDSSSSMDERRFMS